MNPTTEEIIIGLIKDHKEKVFSNHNHPAPELAEMRNNLTLSGLHDALEIIKDGRKYRILMGVIKDIKSL